MCCKTVSGYHADASVQMARFATTADRGWASCIKSRSLLHLSCKSGSLACGRNASGVKARCIRSVSPIIMTIGRWGTDRYLLAQGRPLYKSRLPDFLHEEEGTKGCRRRQHRPGSIRERDLVTELMSLCLGLVWKLYRDPFAYHACNPSTIIL